LPEADLQLAVAFLSQPQRLWEMPISAKMSLLSDEFFPPPGAANPVRPMICGLLGAVSSLRSARLRSQTVRR
jgi:hypothetical protein